MRRLRLLNFLATVLLMLSGLIMLIGLMSEPDTYQATMADVILRLMSMVAAVAVLIGILNLFAVHLGRFSRAEPGRLYSFITIVAALAVIALRIADRADVWPGELAGEQISTRVFEAVQVSLESALAALVLFFLVFAAYRLMRYQVTRWHMLFSVSVIMLLLGWIPLQNIEVLADMRAWLIRVPVSAGARGLLIGVSLGTVTVGVRVLTGQDRSFRS